jgi:hypothetical protein
VHDLSILREGWDSLRREETLLLRATTVEESIRQWVVLQTAFEWQLQQTAPLFAQERWTALAELQARLQRLVD